MKKHDVNLLLFSWIFSIIMAEGRVYLDNCCYNRPFDDQTQLKIQLETLAKLKIQKDIRDGIYELAWSYILDYENGLNPFEEKRQSIEPWRNIASHNVTETADIIRLAEQLKEKGIKTYDSLHIACAVNAGCDFFLTTDKKLLNHKVEGIRIVDPISFISEQEVE